MKQRGQAFPPFHFLISAVLGLAILVIILGIIAYFESVRFGLSQERFTQAVDRALANPTGETISEEKVLFRGGESFSSRTFASPRGMDDSCFELQARETGFVVLESASLVKIQKNTELDVFYQCFTRTECAASALASACDKCCIISFGKEPD